MDQRIGGLDPMNRHANPRGGAPAASRPHERPKLGGTPVTVRAPLLASVLGLRTRRPIHRSTGGHHMLSRVWGLLSGLVLLLILCSTPPAADAGGVVGTGTPASCTETALNAALVGGGAITFSCGPAPVAIALGSTKFPTGATTIDGGGLITLAGTVRVFFVNPGTDLTLRNLTVRDGQGVNGGCLYNNGSLTLTNVIVERCLASNDGGGIYTDVAGATLITASTIRNNAAGFDCGGICTVGVLVVGSSTVSGNLATNAAGGIGCAGGCTVALTDTVVSGNASTGLGGGLFNNQTMILTGVTLSGNTATAGGGLYNNSGTATVSNTTISGNEAIAIFGAGGGVDVEGGTVFLTNVTV